MKCLEPLAQQHSITPQKTWNPRAYCSYDIKISFHYDEGVGHAALKGKQEMGTTFCWKISWVETIWETKISVRV